MKDDVRGEAVQGLRRMYDKANLDGAYYAGLVEKKLAEIFDHLKKRDEARDKAARLRLALMELEEERARPDDAGSATSRTETDGHAYRHFA